MFVSQCFACLEFHNEFIGNKQICKIITQNRSIFVAHLQRMLLFDLDA